MDDKSVVLKSIVDMIDDAVDKKVKTGKMPPIGHLLSTIRDTAALVVEDEAKLNGMININRTSSNSGSYISIDLIDAKSGVQFCSVKMGFSEFGNAVTGLSHMPCKVELHRTDLVGKTHEHKEILVPFNYYGTKHGDQEAAAKALKPYEIDGWKGRKDDLFNHHRSSKDAQGENCQRVTFERFV